MGITLREGRDFTDADTAAMPPVVVVDDVLAKQYFPNESAIGTRVNFGGPITDGKTPWSTIIGVVDHVRNIGPRTSGEGQYYMAALQKSEFTIFFVTRPAAGATPIAPAIRSAVRELDPRLPIARLEPIDAVVTRATARERFAVLLLSGFGLVALVLAGIGLYGVMSYLVGERTREIGVRLALGGRPGHVLARVLGEGISLTLFGLVLGLGIAYLLSETVSTLLFNVTPTDPLTYAAIAGLVLVVAVVAAFLPARRATRVDPLSVLRS
jgi:putative ABC transport system permease protein